MQTNLRYHNRINTQFDASMKSPQGETLTGTIANLSRAGLMIECDRQTIEDLIPNNNPVSPKTPVSLEVDFKLWSASSQYESLTAICNIIHVRRISRETYQVGMEFDHFPNDDYEKVTHYVDQKLQAS